MTKGYQKVLEILKKEGISQDDLQKLAEDITKAASVKFYTEMIGALTEEDLAEIEKCTTQEEANMEIRTRFAQRTGENPDKLMQEFLDKFAGGFLKEYKKKKK